MHLSKQFLSILTWECNVLPLCWRQVIKLWTKSLHTDDGLIETEMHMAH
jgi:hypothetical protein